MVANLLCEIQAISGASCKIVSPILWKISLKTSKKSPGEILGAPPPLILINKKKEVEQLGRRLMCRYG